WSESRSLGDSSTYFGSKQNWFFVFRAAMHDAVSHNVNFSKRRDGTRFTIRQSAQQMFNGFGARADFRLILVHNSVHVFDFGLRDLVVPFSFAFPKWRKRIVGRSLANLVKGALLAAGTGIEHEDLHWLVRPFPVFHLRQIVPVLARVI